MIVFVIDSIKFDFALVLSRVRAKILINTMPGKCYRKEHGTRQRYDFSRKYAHLKLSVAFLMQIEFIKAAIKNKI